MVEGGGGGRGAGGGEGAVSHQFPMSTYITPVVFTPSLRPLTSVHLDFSCDTEFSRVVHHDFQYALSVWLQIWHDC